MPFTGNVIATVGACVSTTHVQDVAVLVFEAADLPDAEDVARAEIAEGQPALARLALERRLGAAKSVADAVEVVLAGRDEELGARWRLVDGDGRQITRLELPD